jgi:hypothetical protein
MWQLVVLPWDALADSQGTCNLWCCSGMPWDALGCSGTSWELAKTVRLPGTPCKQFASEEDCFSQVSRILQRLGLLYRWNLVVSSYSCGVYVEKWSSLTITVIKGHLCTADDMAVVMQAYLNAIPCVIRRWKALKERFPTHPPANNLNQPPWRFGLNKAKTSRRECKVITLCILYRSKALIQRFPTQLFVRQSAIYSQHYRRRKL